MDNQVKSWTKHGRPNQLQWKETVTLNTEAVSFLCKVELVQGFQNSTQLSVVVKGVVMLFNISVNIYK